MISRPARAATPTAAPTAAPTTTLADLIDAALPQTQCTRCGFADCRAYAQAIASGEAGLNQCPPGGEQGIHRLAAITGRPAVALNPTHGVEGPRQLAVIDEAWCIGCTLCIKACPVDCIVGGPKLMHTVINDACTGCELCLPVCPVDCIAMTVATGQKTGWDAWSPALASEARQRYAFHQFRVERDHGDTAARVARKARADSDNPASPSGLNEPAEPTEKRAVIAAAVSRARAKATR